MADDKRKEVQVEEIPVEVVEKEEPVAPDDELTPEELDNLLGEESEPTAVPARKGARLRARRAWALWDTLVAFLKWLFGRS